MSEARAADLEAAAADWTHWLARERRASLNTVAAYQRDLAAFTEFLTRHLGGAVTLAHLEQLRAADVRAYLADARQRGLQSTSLARGLSTVRGFFRFLERTGRVKNAAVAGVRSPKLSRSVPKPLTAEAAQEVLRDADTARQPWIAARDTAQIGRAHV